MDKTTPSYNLNVVVRETGIKPDTLRAWERRYGLPEPMRTEGGGHRLYSDRDIEMIKWFISRQEEGMRIGQVVKMWKELVASGEDPLYSSSPRIEFDAVVDGRGHQADLGHVREAWIRACLAFDEYQADQILAHAFSRYPLNLVVVEVMQKGLAEIGENWFQGEVTVQQEHFTSELVLRRLNAMVATAPAPTRSEKILVGTPPGEEHVFSSLLLVLFLRYQGWDVTYLGGNVPLEDLEATVERVSPDLVLYTATLVTTAAALRKVAVAMRKNGVDFAFGGRAFSENKTLPGHIPGYYLGDLLEGAIRIVADILAGNIEPNDESFVDEKFLQTHDAYGKYLAAINAKLIDSFSNNAEMIGTIAMANERFGDYLLAGLSLGDLALVENELQWTFSLIDNSDMPVQMLQAYLSQYQHAIKSLMGQDGQLLVDWLDQIKF